MKQYEEYKESNIQWVGEIPSHWDVIPLGKLGRLTTSSVDKTIDENQAEVKLLNYLDIYKNQNREINNNINFMKVTATEQQIKTSDVKKGDVFFTPSSETVDDIGHSAVVLEEIENILFSYHIVRLRFKKEIDLKFKKYLFNNYFVLNKFSSKATGTTRKTLSSNDFKNTYVVLPPF